MKFCAEVLLVSVPIGHLLQGSDLIVAPLQWSAGDRLVEPVADFRAIPFQHVRHCEQHADSRGPMRGAPVSQKSGCGYLACRLPELTQVFQSITIV